MPTNLALDDKLIKEALRIGGHRTKREAVNEALREYVRQRRRLRALEAFGTVAMDSDYDYKVLRRRR